MHILMFDQYRVKGCRNMCGLVLADPQYCQKVYKVSLHFQLNIFLQIFANYVTKLSILDLGTIYKRHRHFFLYFRYPLPHVRIFLLLFVGNFGQFLCPPPTTLPTSFIDGPLNRRKNRL